MFKTKIYNIVLFLFFSLWVNLYANASDSQPLTSQQSLSLIYIESAEGQNSVVYQAYESAKWQKPKKISKGNSVKYTPSLLSLGSEAGASLASKPKLAATSDLLAVWVESENPQSSQILFRVYNSDNGVWTDLDVIPTLSKSVSAPVLARDHEGKVWCAWVGFDGVDDEIYLSSFSSETSVGDDELVGNWSKTKKVYLNDNDVPDIHPKFVYRPNKNNDTLMLHWQRFDQAQLKYVSFEIPVSDSLGAGDSVKPLIYRPTPFSKLQIDQPPSWLTLPREVTDFRNMSMVYKDASAHSRQSIDFR